MAKQKIGKELSDINSKPNSKLSSYGIALSRVCNREYNHDEWADNDKLIAEYELIKNKKSNVSANTRNAILYLFEHVIRIYVEKTQKKTE